MEKVEIIDPCVDPRWDTFVENHPLGWIVHTSGWKASLESTFPHIRGYFFVLIESETNTIKAGLPIYEVRSWLTGNRLVSIPFATLSDPLVSSQDQCAQLLDAAKALLEKNRCSYMEIRTFKANEWIGDRTFAETNDYIHDYLDLSVGQETLWKNLSYKSIRYRINKTTKNNLVLQTADNEQGLRTFYLLYAATRKRLGLPSQPYHFFKNLYDRFSPTGNVCVFLAQFEERMIAGQFIFKFKGRFSVEALGDDPFHRHLHGGHFLYWEGIKAACREGFQIYDFGRTSLRNSTLMNFKKRWGTRRNDLRTFFYDRTRKPFRSINREESSSYKLMQFLCRKTPAPLQPALSNFCYRHLG